VIAVAGEGGEVTAAPPQTNAAWQHLIGHYVRIAQVTPEQAAGSLDTAVLTFTSVPHAHQHFQQQLARIPHTERPPSLQKLLASLSSSPCSPAPLRPLSPSAAMIAIPSTSFAARTNGSQWIGKIAAGAIPLSRLPMLSATRNMRQCQVNGGNGRCSCMDSYREMKRPSPASKPTRPSCWFGGQRGWHGLVMKCLVA